MRPYENVRLIEGPDVGDIHSQARKSSIGKTRRGKMTRTWTNNPKIKHNDRGYVKSEEKKRTRRAIKRGDKARSLKAELDLEKQAEADAEIQDMIEQDALYGDYDYDEYDVDDYDYDDYDYDHRNNF